MAINAKIDTLRVTDKDGQEHALYPRTSTKAVVNAEGQTVEQMLEAMNEKIDGAGIDIDLTDYYTKTEVDELIPDTSDLASTDYVDEALKNVEVDLTGYATEDFVTETLGDYATNSQVDEKIESLNLGEDNIINSVSVDGTVLTPDENGNVNIIMPEIPSTEGLVSEELLADTLSDYAKSADIKEYDDTALSNRVTELENDLGGHIVKSDVPANAKFTDTVYDDSELVNKVSDVEDALDSKVPTSRTVNGKALSNNISLSASDVGADVSGTATSIVSSHNTSTSAHSDIRNLITALSTKVNNFLDVDDATTDQLSEVITLITDNQDLIEGITTSKVSVSDIINNLNTNVANKPLSASQGVVIKGLIDALQTEVNAKAKASDLTSHTGNNNIHITPTERTNWTDANTKKHEHGNKSVLDGITSDLIDTWNNALEVDTTLSVAGKAADAAAVGNSLDKKVSTRYVWSNDVTTNIAADSGVQATNIAMNGFVSMTASDFTTPSGASLNQLNSDLANYLPLTGGKVNGSFWVGNNVNIWTDSEGGNILLISPNGQNWEIDAYSNTSLRLFTYGSATNGNAVKPFVFDENGHFSATGEVADGYGNHLSTKLNNTNPYFAGTLSSGTLTVDNKQVINATAENLMCVGNPSLAKLYLEVNGVGYDVEELGKLRYQVVTDGRTIDDLRTYGHYSINSQVANPVAGWCNIIVLPYNNDPNYCEQILTHMDTGRIYYRRCGGGSWNAWTTVTVSSDLANYLPLSGGGMTGRIAFSKTLMDSDTNPTTAFTNPNNFFLTLYNYGDNNFAGISVNMHGDILFRTGVGSSHSFAMTNDGQFTIDGNTVPTVVNGSLTKWREIGADASSFTNAAFVASASYSSNNAVRAGYGFHNAGCNGSFLYLETNGNYRSVNNLGGYKKIMDSDCFTVSNGVLTINLD